MAIMLQMGGSSRPSVRPSSRMSAVGPATSVESKSISVPSTPERSSGHRTECNGAHVRLSTHCAWAGRVASVKSCDPASNRTRWHPVPHVVRTAVRLRSCERATPTWFRAIRGNLRTVLTIESAPAIRCHMAAASRARSETLAMWPVAPSEYQAGSPLLDSNTSGQPRPNSQVHPSPTRSRRCPHPVSV